MNENKNFINMKAIFLLNKSSQYISLTSCLVILTSSEKKTHSNGEKNKNIKDLISNTIKGSLFAVVAVRKKSKLFQQKETIYM